MAPRFAHFPNGIHKRQPVDILAPYAAAAAAPVTLVLVVLLGVFAAANCRLQAGRQATAPPGTTHL